MTSKVVTGFGAALLVCSVAASAQTLGDLAKQEEARRKAIASPAKVYTNESLRPAPQPSTPAPSTGAAAATSTSTSSSTPDASTGSPDASTSAASGAQSEAAWKKKMTDARDALDRSKTFADALQSRINALTNDFFARDDPAQRAQIGADRDKALAELDRVKKEIDANTKAIADIQDDARKAGVPAGWVR